MASIKEIKQELRHREWSEKIQECQNSGMTVKEWCESSGIKMLTTDSKWFGVTYAEDKPLVEQRVLKWIEDGIYPDKLWG